MIDIEITLRRLFSAAAWLVGLRSTEDPTFLEVPPLTDEDLADLTDLAPTTLGVGGREPGGARF